MSTNPQAALSLRCSRQAGVTLVELVVFILIVGIASAALMKVYTYSAMHSADPIEQVRAFESAQSRLDEILALKYDANTPTGDIPACDSIDPAALACTNAKDGIVNDLDDFDDVDDIPYPGYTREVKVTIGTDEKLISVKVTTPKGQVITLAAYRANF